MNRSFSRGSVEVESVFLLRVDALFLFELKFTYV